MLKANRLTIKFGGLVAVSDFSIEIGDKEVVGLIGPNGAGKTAILDGSVGEGCCRVPSKESRQ